MMTIKDQFTWTISLLRLINRQKLLSSKTDQKAHCTKDNYFKDLHPLNDQT